MIRFQISGWIGRAIGIVLLVLLQNTLVVGREEANQIPAINIVLLDDGSAGLSQGIHVRRNNWDEWKNRLPTFLKRLRMVAGFTLGTKQDPEPSASLYAIEIPSSLSPAKTDEIIASELERISNSTKRPSAILARSSAGNDQLRIVFQDWNDYTPSNATKLLRVFREISPAIAHSHLANSFGPFKAPPTFIFDPRIPLAHTDWPENDWPKKRWGVLEETYLLPHYVLHCIAVLNDAVRKSERTYYECSIPEPGTLTVVLAPQDILNTACATIAQSQSPELIPRIMASDFLKNPNIKSGSMIACPTPNIVTQSVMPQRTQFYRVISHLEQQGIPYNVVAGNDIGAVTAIKTLNRIPDSHRKNVTLIEPLTGLMGTSTRDFESIGINKLNPSVLVTRTLLNRQSIDHLSELVPRVFEVNADKVSLAIGGGVGPLSGSVSIPTTPSLWQQKDMTRSVKVHLPGQEWSGSFNTSNLIAISDQSISSFPANGGVLFNKGNIYSLDFSGRVNILGDEAIAALNASNGVGAMFQIDGRTQLSVGIPMGKGKKINRPSRSEVDLLMYQRDMFSTRMGYLPQAIARFQCPKDRDIPRFGGEWTFEPVTVHGTDKRTRNSVFSTKQEFTVIPHETGNRLRYVLRTGSPKTETRNADKMSIISYWEPKKSEFEPALLAHEDGRISWVLCHGVVVHFTGKGLVSEIEHQDKEWIRYIRSKNRMTGKASSDGQFASIQYKGAYPTRVETPDSSPTQYVFSSKHLAKVETALQCCILKYDQTSRLSSIEVNDGVVNLKYDSKGHLTEVTCPRFNVILKRTYGKNSLKVLDADKKIVEWWLRPNSGIAGVTKEDTGMLWTKSSDGRIIQLAIGKITPTAEGHKFIPSTLIGTMP